MSSIVPGRRRTAADSLPPPAAPSGLTAVYVSLPGVALDWTDNSDNEGSFEIQRSPNGSAWSTIATVSNDVTHYEDGSVTSGTYYYRVRAVAGGIPSDWSNTALAT